MIVIFTFADEKLTLVFNESVKGLISTTKRNENKTDIISEYQNNEN